MKLRDKLSRLSLPPGAGAAAGRPSPAARVTQVEMVVERDEPEPLDAIDAALARVDPSEREVPATFREVGGDHGERLSRLRAQLSWMEGRVDKPLASARAVQCREESERARAEQRLRFEADALPGELRQTPQGLLRSVVTRHQEDHCHGSIPVALALESCARDLSVLALDPALDGVDFARALYIDTETTGLSGGSGTLPFLIGMAWFEGRELVVEQMLLERPGHEAAMLVRLAEQITTASCIVSYNGKSFDWPLLRTRYILNRVPAPRVPAHLDLLHCARRVYKRRLGAVRLVHLEEEILGFTRIDDISGELIPQTYLGFLRGQVPARELVPIVDHNRHDLVALAAMQGEIVRRFRALDAAQDARDQLGFARVAARASDRERALSFAQGAAEADVRGELAPEALYLAGELKLKQGDLEGARLAYLQSAQSAPAHSEQASRAHLALAKLLEHRLKQYEQALAHAQHCAAAEGAAACQKRVERLSRKSGAALRLL